MVKAIFTLPSTYQVAKNVYEHYTTTVTIYKKRTLHYLIQKVFERNPIEIIGDISTLE